ncbi:DUF6397 family protein [Streptomyces termitum]|uniref:DUF6397 family protein n=1 Tax=Streptomyces termitum TaxID=67368 RepID=UPI0033BD32E4
MTVDEATRTVTPARAAEELELKRDEFRLAVRMGLVRTVPAPEGAVRDRGGGRDRVPERRPVERAELDRLKAAPDFPGGLRERVRTVGAGEAAALLSVTPARFNRLVRTGHLSPVRFYLNRYRTVIWLYVAAEVTAFGEGHSDLLRGRLPADLRARADSGEDLRARNWRSRYLALLLRGTPDPWARAALIASLLSPDQVAELVPDPVERTLLDRLRPAAPPGFPTTGAARETAERLVRADALDEIAWYRTSLGLTLAEARLDASAPNPGASPDRPARQTVPEPAVPRPRPAPEPEPDAATEPAGGPPPAREWPRAGVVRPLERSARTRRAGLLARLRRTLPTRAPAGHAHGRRREHGRGGPARGAGGRRHDWP